MMHIKLRAVRRGGHVHCDVFIAPAGDQTYANAGRLTLRPGEYQIFAAALHAAREAWPAGHLAVHEEGDSAEVLSAETPPCLPSLETAERVSPPDGVRGGRP